jgi:predicted transcriptional regulator
MRTTVELSDEIRAKLMELAARRGDRGFSALVEEAVARYLDDEEERRRLATKARAVLGTLSEEDAVELDESVRALRGRWR